MTGKKLTEKEHLLRSKIAGCFKKHFVYFGYKKTSVDEIARELKISKKTIYKFFPGKKKVYSIIIDKIATVYNSTIFTRLRPISSARGKIKKLVPLIFRESRKLNKNDSLDTRFKNELASQAFTKAYKQLIENLIFQGIKNKEFYFKNSSMTILFIQAIISESITLIEEYDILLIEKETLQIIYKILN